MKYVNINPLNYSEVIKMAKANVAPMENKTIHSGSFDKTKINRLRRVTVPLLKQKDEVEYFIKFIAPYEKASEIKRSSRSDRAEREGQKKEPPYLARVINLETGEEMDIIVNAVLKSTLDDEFPDNGYVGKSFEIVRHSIAGRDYKTYDVTEIDW